MSTFVLVPMIARTAFAAVIVFSCLSCASEPKSDDSRPGPDAAPADAPPPAYIAIPLGPPPPLPGEPGFNLPLPGDNPFGLPPPTTADWSDAEGWGFAINGRNQVAGVIRSENYTEGLAVFRFSHQPHRWELYEPVDMTLFGGVNLRRPGVDLDDKGTVYAQFRELPVNSLQVYASEFTGPPMGPAGWTFKRAIDGWHAVSLESVNSRGSLAVTLWESTSHWRAARSVSEGVLTLLSEYGFPDDINNFDTVLGHIYGEPGEVLWTTEGVESPPDDLVSPMRLNDNGDFAGNYEIYVDGVLHSTLFLFKDAGLESSTVTEMNNHGDVVGWTSEDDDPHGHQLDHKIAVLIRGGQQLYRLNDLVDDDSWVFTHAYDINDGGYITGSGLWKGRRWPYLLIPAEQ